MTIDAFAFDERNTARKITMNATKGAFRFITGNSEKQAYTINLPRRRRSAFAAPACTSAWPAMAR